MKKFKSYIAIDKEEAAFVYYFQSETSKRQYPEDDYYIYEVTSLKQLYQLLSDLGYDDEYFENFIGHRLTADEHLDLASRDYEEVNTDIYWEGITYELTYDSYSIGPTTAVYHTEEELKKALKEYGPQVISFKKCTNGVLLGGK